MQAPIPPQMKEAILDTLPEFVEHVDEATRKIYDPSAVWLESVQFADYVSQMADHLAENHGDECRQQVAEQLKLMSETFKDVAENAMKILDESEKVFNRGTQQ